MADEDLTQDQDDSAASQPAEKADDRKALIKDRDAAKKKAREAESKARELEEKLTAREREDADRAEAEERKKNDFAALDERRRKQLEAAEKRAAEAEAKIQARERADREGALVDAVMPKLGLTNRTVVRGVLKALSDGGIDIAPETMDDKYAADVAKQVRDALGELYPARSGGSPGTPGVNLSTKKPGEKPDENPALAAVRAAAKRHSDRLQ